MTDEERIEMIDEKIYNLLAEFADLIREECDYCMIKGKCDGQRDCYLELHDYVMGRGRYEVNE